ncbi:alpha-amylase family protein [Tanticharoenia sakaeratensis]|uniref:Enterotoxin n=1 Tax=Tanticharoenia sakaeratensis NBRC 103193 TaxID=1231623 RepID=A0A0D6ML18_9PROT|nr:enterotoxin [Tanticharoenia sakaeratensis]GAN54317.1 enterotoxin [Tanticharoenia sakaeratensis NBRC 103193]GBQ18967.1 enterotoxin [Tanticharoenia sakaeratensis NBRC 103193]
MTAKRLLPLAALLSGTALAAQPPLTTGAPRTTLSATGGQFGNAAIGFTWTTSNNRLTDAAIIDRLHGNRSLHLVAPFSIRLATGETITSAMLTLDHAPELTRITADPEAARAADQKEGLALRATFHDPKNRLTVAWRLEQRDQSPYLRELISVTANGAPLPIKGVDLLDAWDDDGEVSGDVDGSPVVIGDMYFGIENPLSNNLAFNGRSRLTLPQALPLQPGHTLDVSAVAGVVRHGQMRRDFQLYLEAQRAHPYRPFLNYNSWYDIGYFTPYTQAQAEDRIRTFGDELVRKRGVQLDSFLFDDGWDDYKGNWDFSRDFPKGFAPLADLARQYGAQPGIWLSPWGGYGKPVQMRVEAGRKLGYETAGDGFALSGPHYYQRFHDVVMHLLDQGVNQFKFDGTGNADKVVPGSPFMSDFDAAIHLIGDIRADKPQTYINLTTGTYPSPFWLCYADSIWRGGEDDMLLGVGTKRQRWITYRDSDTYHNIVVRAPLFPLNSLMLHGIIFAQKNQRLNTDPGHDFADEVHSFFATGTQEQELYVTPSLLHAQDWDLIAQTAKWARTNADILRDSHWVGGDPGRLEVYGWAAWTPQKAFLTLRNPDDRPQRFLLDLRRALELPDGETTRFAAHALWSHGNTPGTLDADTPVVITLAPFELRTLELIPAKN